MVPVVVIIDGHKIWALGVTVAPQAEAILTGIAKAETERKAKWG